MTHEQQTRTPEQLSHIQSFRDRHSDLSLISDPEILALSPVFHLPDAWAPVIGPDAKGLLDISGLSHSHILLDSRAATYRAGLQATTNGIKEFLPPDKVVRESQGRRTLLYYYADEIDRQLAENTLFRQAAVQNLHALQTRRTMAGR